MDAYTSNSVDVAKMIVDEDSTLNGTSTLFRELVKKQPAIAYKLLNDCCTVEDDSITFDFKYIEDTSYQSEDSSQESPEDSPHNAEELSVSSEQHTSDEREDSPSELQSIILAEEPSQNAEGNLSVSVKQPSQCLGTCLDTKPHILELMESCDSDDSDVLLHPVVQCLLRWKWSHYIVFFYGINLAIFMVYLGFLTAFALSVPNPQISLCSNETITECEHSLPRRGFLGFAAFVTIGFSIFRLLLECGQLINMKKLIQRLGCCNEGDNGQVIKLEYFRSLSNYLEIPMYLLSIAFVATTNSCFCPSPLQWQAGTVAVFFAWINFILFLNKWPDLGIYIGIVWKITIRFLSVSVIATLLLLSFTFAFFMAFYEPDLPDTPFESPLVTFVTMISFAISTPDISIFRLANDDTREDTIPYPVLSFIIWIIFGVIMSVLFLNFLVGLAVDDVAALRKQAKKDRTRIMINLFKSVEEMIKIFDFLALKWNWF